MQNSKTKQRTFGVQIPARAAFVFMLISLAALMSSFVIAISAATFFNKIVGFGVIFLGFVLLLGLFFSRFKTTENRPVDSGGEDPELKTDSKTKKALSILDEAGRFFSASLKSDDMFRLLASRIEEVIPHQSAVLYLADEKGRLKALHATGEYSREMTKILLECDQGIAGKSFISGEVEFDDELSLDRECIDKELLIGIDSSMAVPLTRGVETYGVLVIYGASMSDADIELLDKIGEKISPLLTSSFSFEENISNSMIDSLTNLPNERAFYLVLENQLAEAHRFHKQRDLTILTVDIKDFADFNRMYGHSTGDSLLAFAAEVIGGELRQMDFLCRSMSDEFWVVLPTASSEVTKKVITRIELAFAANIFDLPGREKYNAQLNFGSATFMIDGETTNQLLQNALLDKKQRKQDGQSESSVIMFPKEYVN